MRFVIRSLVGLTMMVAAVALVAMGLFSYWGAQSARSGGPDRGGPEERVFAVDMGVVANQSLRPVITAYGEIRSWRTLELRASSGGYLVELSDRFRDGVEVEEGELLFKIDPDDFASRVEDADAAIDEARADLSEAKQAVLVAEEEQRAAELQRDLRASALERRTDLRARGVSTAAEVEEAEMAFASAEQTVASRRQSQLAAEMRIERSELRLRRAMLTADEARRALSETDHHAPYAGLLADVTASLGALATPNERLGLLIDPRALEVVFRVTNAQFARLIDERGALKPIPVSVTLELDDTPLTVAGTLDRASAQIGQGETGRLVYARLALESATLLRPGDFVTVTIEEPTLDGVALLQSSAVTEAGELLVVDETDRLRAVQVRILRRQGDDVIVAGAPEGVRYVKERAPQLGRGVKVRSVREDAEGDAVSSVEIEGDVASASLVEIDPERQKRLIGFVEKTDRMPADMKVRILSTLRSGRAPKPMIERIEARMGDAG